MIEHALGLQWLADAAEDAVDALLTGHRETWRKVAGSMTDGWVVTAEDLNPVVAGVVANLLFVASVGFNKILTGQLWTGRLGEIHARMDVAINGSRQG